MRHGAEGQEEPGRWGQEGGVALESWGSEGGGLELLQMLLQVDGAVGFTEEGGE